MLGPDHGIEQPGRGETRTIVRMHHQIAAEHGLDGLAAHRQLAHDVAQKSHHLVVAILIDQRGNRGITEGVAEVEFAQKWLQAGRCWSSPTPHVGPVQVRDAWDVGLSQRSNGHTLHFLLQGEFQQSSKRSASVSLGSSDFSNGNNPTLREQYEGWYLAKSRPPYQGKAVQVARLYLRS